MRELILRWQGYQDELRDETRSRLDIAAIQASWLMNHSRQKGKPSIDWRKLAPRAEKKKVWYPDKVDKVEDIVAEIDQRIKAAQARDRAARAAAKTG